MWRKSARESERMKDFENQRNAYMNNFNNYLDNAGESDEEQVDQYLS